MKKSIKKSLIWLGVFYIFVLILTALFCYQMEKLDSREDQKYYTATFATNIE